MAGRRGILGVKKDPKHQMLFMFRGEQWPSSDSDDTDYEPGQARQGANDSEDSDDSVVEIIPSSSRRSSKTTKRPVRRKNGENSSPSSSSSSSSSSRLSNNKRRQPAKKKATKAKRRKLPDGPSDHSTRTASSSRSAPKGMERGDVAVVVEEGANAKQLPVELWMKIFEFVVSMHGTLPFLCRAARVCHEWNDLTREPSLWRKVDLSFGWIRSTDQTLKYLARNRLSQCREVSLNGWKKVTDEAIQVLCENCPHLEAVNLSHCSKLSMTAVSTLAHSCQKLKHLDLSFAGTDAVSVKSLTHFTESRGPSLRDLILEGNMLTGFNAVINSVMSHCRHLDTLDLSNCLFTTNHLVLNVERLQERCPALRLLRLANCFVRASGEDRPHQGGVGFAKLQELSCAMPIIPDPSFLQRGVTDPMLIRLLHKADRMRLLDLRGCTNMNPTCSFLPEGAPSPIKHLEELYLARSSVPRYMEALVEALRQWSASLRVVDLAWITPSAASMVRALEALADCDSSPLAHLNLAGSSASERCVTLALKRFRQLQSLDLTSCRSLPRGIKSLHSGTAALRKLRASLRLLETNDSDTDSY